MILSLPDLHKDETHSDRPVVSSSPPSLHTVAEAAREVKTTTEAAREVKPRQKLRDVVLWGLDPPLQVSKIKNQGRGSTMRSPLDQSTPDR
ncbi:hypothetical protein RRG08_023264 [Elysia crispata]|uniref:Uncharacterized protein n=1 Tax=Elysia crispata TaxID=231223 RepID=A0AAE1DVF1_9GAST|nr:hypothetical protein RRG08_023264 [Elysia crispata]